MDTDPRNHYNSISNINSTGTVPVIAGTVNRSCYWLLVSTIPAVGSPNSITYSSQNFNKNAAVAASPLTLNDILIGGGLNVVPATAIPNGITATTQTAGDNSTKIATTAYVATAVNAGTNNPGSAFSVPALGGFTGVNIGGVERTRPRRKLCLEGRF